MRQSSRPLDVPGNAQRPTPPGGLSSVHSRPLLILGSHTESDFNALLRYFAAILLAVSLPRLAIAELTKLTVDGVVTFSFAYPGGGGPAVGEPATISLTVDRTDLEPSSNAALFQGFNPSIKFLSDTYHPAAGEHGRLSVRLNGPNADIIQYQGGVQDLDNPEPYVLDFRFSFPDGTLTDSFPDSLPLSTATVSSFRVLPGFQELVYGPVLTYRSDPIVPEPTHLGGLFLVGLLLTRERKSGHY